MRSSGSHIEDAETVVSREETCLSVSPDGITIDADGSQCRLEILNDYQKLDNLFAVGRFHVVKSLQNGQCMFKNGLGGYYLQIQLHVTHMQLCKLVIWTPNESTTRSTVR